MPTAYTWQFESLDVYPTYAGLTNAVESMHWRLTADDGFGHQASAYGEVKAGPVDPDNFIPFASLTLATVQGWCEAQIGSDLSGIQSRLGQLIAEQTSPTTASLSPPWA